METIGKTLQRLRKESNLSVSDVSKRMGELGFSVAGKTISGYESDQRMPNADVFLALCEIYGCRNVMETFRCVEMSRSIPTDEEWAMIEAYRGLSLLGQDAVDWALSHESDRDAELLAARATVVEFRPHREIPLYQRVSAGDGEMLVCDGAVGSVEIEDSPENAKAAYAVTVSGRSMEPMYMDGDVLLVEPRNSVSVGEVGVFVLGGSVYVKRRGRDALVSVNRECADVDADEEIRCIGRVVGVLGADAAKDGQCVTL